MEASSDYVPGLRSIAAAFRGIPLGSPAVIFAPVTGVPRLGVKRL
jgi:hypothetical protein